VLEVCAALMGEGRARPLSGSRWDWAAQDVGYRLLGLRANQRGELARALDVLIDALAAARTERGISACIRDYERLHSELRKGTRSRHALPTPERLFALGYPLPHGYGSDLAQIQEGVASACPSTLRALGKESDACVRAFCAADAPERLPIGKRFAGYLSRTRPGPCAELAAVEAAITHVPPRAPWADCLDPFEARGTGLTRAPGVEIVIVTHDVMGLAPARVAQAKRLPEARALLVLRRAGQPVDVLELALELGRSLRDAEPGARLPDALLASEPTARDELLAAGVLVPTAYAD
jgi:hypothetical protein